MVLSGYDVLYCLGCSQGDGLGHSRAETVTEHITAVMKSVFSDGNPLRDGLLCGTATTYQGYGERERKRERERVSQTDREGKNERENEKVSERNGVCYCG